MVRLSDNGDAAGDEEAAGLGEICGGQGREPWKIKAARLQVIKTATAFCGTATSWLKTSRQAGISAGTAVQTPYGTMGWKMARTAKQHDRKQNFNLSDSLCAKLRGFGIVEATQL